VRVGLYHPWVYLRSGIERWMLEVVARSRHDWVIYTHHHNADATYPEVAGLDLRELSPRISVRRSLGPLVHAAATMARSQLPGDGCDAMLVSSEGLGDLVALRATVPVAAYCHTPLKIRHDPAAAAVVRRQSAARRLALASIGPTFDAIDRVAWRRYRHVLVNSSETLARVQSAGLRPMGPLEVLEPGVDESWFPAQVITAREQVFLYAGRIMWQKNIELAIEAIRLLPGTGARLVVAGMVDAKSEPYLAQLRELARGLPVTFEVAPPDERLRELYSTSTALVFPARNEDFGMVVLEAMAAGTPVLAVDAGGPRTTVAHGRTGWLLPAEPQAFADQMSAVLDAGSGLAVMRHAARAEAGRRGWASHVQRLDDVLEGLLPYPSSPASSPAASRQVRLGGGGTANPSLNATAIASDQAATSPTGT
jgi:glycosyltransferase involved in cell wall biosynthesis